MNEKMNYSDASDATRGCERADELVTYMYGEAGAEEAGLFRQHLNVCPVCRDEMSAFGDVRQAVGDWRMEALSQVPALSHNQSFIPATHISETAGRKRSAVAAIREFFSLSPLWLQAGTVAAVFALCALAAHTLARTEIRTNGYGIAARGGAQERIIKERVEVPAPNTYTQEQVNALIEEKLNQRMEIARAEWQKEQTRKVQILEASTPNVSRRNVAPRDALASNSPRTSGRKQPAPRNADARNNLYQVAENDSLPRLTDLLGEVNENNK